MFDYLVDWVLPFLIVLSVLVFVHELGHYLVARFCGVRVEIFSIGFGREIFGFNDRHRTRWKFSLIPLGGYVKMFGETDGAEDEDAPPMSVEDQRESFHHKRVGQRAWIVAAGPLANFIFAIVLMIGVFVGVGIPAPLAGVGTVMEGSAAARAGFEKGDRIVRIDGDPVEWFEDVRLKVRDSAETPLAFDILRGDADIQLTAVPDRAESDEGAPGEPGVGLLGIRPDPGQIGYERVGVFSAVGEAFHRYYGLTSQILTAIGQIVTGSRSTDELGGPIRIAQLSGQMAQDGFISLVFFMAALSINLGLINLLPVPMLDGGHLAFYLIEAVRGKPVNKRVQEYGFRLGMVFVLLLIILATWNDLVNLKIFDFFRDISG
jgi:regulator of sigma E protease